MTIQLWSTPGTSADQLEQSHSGHDLPLSDGSEGRNVLVPVQGQELGYSMGKEPEYSTQEAADLLGIASRTTIWEAYNRGDIKGRKQGRRGAIKIPRSELIKFAERFNYPLPPELAENQ